MQNISRSFDAQVATEMRSFLQKVYAWMLLGLTISGVTAYWIASNSSLTEAIIGNSLHFTALIIFELAVVIGLIFLINRVPVWLAVTLFVFYCFLTGLTLSVVFLLFAIESIGLVFLISAGMFGAMSVYGLVTKRDLSGIGQVLVMGLFGIVLASLINLFLQNQTLDYILSYIGVVVFTGLTAYDTQKIRNENIIGNHNTAADHKEAIMGALTLYLDFINLFLDLLKIFGKRK